MLLKTNGVRIKTLEFLSKKLDEMRIKIYDNNGTDIFDTDNKKVGFIDWHQASEANRKDVVSFFHL